MALSNSPALSASWAACNDLATSGRTSTWALALNTNPRASKEVMQIERNLLGALVLEDIKEKMKKRLGMAEAE